MGGRASAPGPPRRRRGGCLPCPLCPRLPAAGSFHRRLSARPGATGPPRGGCPPGTRAGRAQGREPPPALREPRGSFHVPGRLRSGAGRPAGRLPGGLPESRRGTALGGCGGQQPSCPRAQECLRGGRGRSQGHKGPQCSGSDLPPAPQLGLDPQGVLKALPQPRDPLGGAGLTWASWWPAPFAGTGWSGPQDTDQWGAPSRLGARQPPEGPAPAGGLGACGHAVRVVPRGRVWPCQEGREGLHASPASGPGCSFQARSGHPHRWQTRPAKGPSKLVPIQLLLLGLGCPPRPEVAHRTAPTDPKLCLLQAVWLGEGSPGCPQQSV